MIEKEIAHLRELLSEWELKLELLDFERRGLLQDYMAVRLRRSGIGAAFSSEARKTADKQYSVSLWRRTILVGNKVREARRWVKKLNNLIQVRQRKLDAGMSPEDLQREELEAKLKRRQKRRRARSLGR